jgi:hypothetical protein
VNVTNNPDNNTLTTAGATIQINHAYQNAWTNLQVFRDNIDLQNTNIANVAFLQLVGTIGGASAQIFSPCPFQYVVGGNAIVVNVTSNGFVWDISAYGANATEDKWTIWSGSPAAHHVLNFLVANVGAYTNAVVWDFTTAGNWVKASYLSSDGSIGVSGSATGTNTITIKDGIVTHIA